jgi:hypothetical protein
MPLTICSAEARARQLTAHHGADPLAPEAMSEALRLEVLAARVLPRHVLLDRVARRLELDHLQRETADEALAELESLGDVVAGRGSEIGAAPVRAVELGGGAWALLGTISTAELRRRLQGPAATLTPGTPRRLVAAAADPSAPDPTAALAAAVEKAIGQLRGRVLTAAAWAGLDRSSTGQAFLDELDERAEQARPGEHGADSLDWTQPQRYEPRADRPDVRRRWRSCAMAESPGLHRARQPGGWTAHAWSCRSGDESRLLRLAGDEARRAMFAVDQQVGMPSRLEARAWEGSVYLHLTALLPRAEYRWLLLTAERERQRPLVYRIGLAAWPALRQMLVDRLGIVVEEREETPWPGES